MNDQQLRERAAKAAEGKAHRVIKDSDWLRLHAAIAALQFADEQAGYCPHGYAIAANCDQCFAERSKVLREAALQVIKLVKDGESVYSVEHVLLQFADEVRRFGQPQLSGVDACVTQNCGTPLESGPHLGGKGENPDKTSDPGASSPEPPCPRCAQLERALEDQHAATDGLHNALDAARTKIAQLERDKEELVEACKEVMEEFNDRYDGAPDAGYTWMACLMHTLATLIQKHGGGK